MAEKLGLPYPENPACCDYGGLKLLAKESLVSPVPPRGNAFVGENAIDILLLLLFAFELKS